MSSHEAECSDRRKPGKVRQIPSPDTVVIKYLAQEHTNLDDTEPGEDGEVIEGVEALWEKPQPDQPGKIECLALQIDT